jgi:dynein heavy chain
MINIDINFDFSKAVLRYAGEKKRTNPKMTDEEVRIKFFRNNFSYLLPKVLLLSMLDMNAPKMTAQDLPLFENLVEDLFPNISIPKIDYSKV